LSSKILVDEITGKTTAGLVKFPDKPAWRIGLSGNQTISQGSSLADVAFDNSSSENCFIQGGCTLSSGVITVPVAGLYQVNTTLRINSVSANYFEIYITRNNVSTGYNTFSYQLIGSPNSTYDSGSASSVFSLSASDNIRVEVYGGGDTSYNVSQYSVFSGVFLG